MKKILTFVLLFVGTLATHSQADIEEINKTLYDYIDGTANGEPERLKQAFHEDFNLYFVQNDSLKIWSGKQYIANIKPGRKSNRIGKVLSIDFEGNAAIAKIEILMPARKRIYTDYLMLLKVRNHWKIIHKSFTYKNYPE
ncbi:nuclear transport factor 2 family protein [Flagellimonas sp. CMM7]|uniref:nuclear transport factor 2 family protein n=1 Tax=Flagellimonas sp. CMM7 TaxID=2654676 RepID=UPI0013D51E57|nr:nuclear transport factor 2 family protein [Flagellimonas sp. CMM7]UII80647.1 nuclear transport factor 2 family protein [Flagellimonas sp. CMM7]